MLYEEPQLSDFALAASLIGPPFCLLRIGPALVRIWYQNPGKKSHSGKKSKRIHVAPPIGSVLAAIMMRTIAALAIVTNDISKNTALSLPLYLSAIS
jgi:hypothetical protein